jgi:hypothetical protein
MTSLSLTNPTELKKGFYQQQDQQSKTTLNQLFESIDHEDDVEDFIPSPILSTITIYSDEYDSEDAFIEEFYLSKTTDPSNNQEEGSEWSDDECLTKEKKNILSKIAQQCRNLFRNFTIFGLIR